MNPTSRFALLSPTVVLTARGNPFCGSTQMGPSDRSRTLRGVRANLKIHGVQEFKPALKFSDKVEEQHHTVC